GPFGANHADGGRDLRAGADLRRWPVLLLPGAGERGVAAAGVRRAGRAARPGHARTVRGHRRDAPLGQVRAGPVRIASLSSPRLFVMDSTPSRNSHVCCEKSPPPAAEPGVKRPLTPRRRRRPVENDEYAAFVRRVLRGYARRVTRGDIDAITDMAAIAGELDTAIRQAVNGLRSAGYWAEIAAKLGVTRQASQQRWGGSEQELTIGGPLRTSPLAHDVTGPRGSHGCTTDILARRQGGLPPELISTRRWAYH